MKKIGLTSIALIVISITLNAQYQMDWGKCTRSDFQMEKYEYDTTAKAVILHDVANIFTSLDPDEYIFVHHRRIKILEESGIVRFPPKLDKLPFWRDL